MKLAMNFKEGEKRLFTQEETDIIVKNMNYIKLLQFFTGGDKDLKDKNVKILGNNIPCKDIYSIEFIL